MRSKVAPSVASFLRYGASNLPPRICSKSLFSSTTITMWSYTGSVAGQGGLSAAIAVPAVHNATAITMQSSDVFVICPPPGGSRLLRLRAASQSSVPWRHIHRSTVPARRYLCYHCVRLLLALSMRESGDVRRPDFGETCEHNGVVPCPSPRVCAPPTSRKHPG